MSNLREAASAHARFTATTSIDLHFPNSMSRSQKGRCPLNVIFAINPLTPNLPIRLGFRYGSQLTFYHCWSMPVRTIAFENCRHPHSATSHIHMLGDSMSRSPQLHSGPPDPNQPKAEKNWLPRRESHPDIRFQRPAHYDYATRQLVARVGNSPTSAVCKTAALILS